MKRTLLAIALSAAAVGYACAQDYRDQELAPVVVEHVDVDRLVENCAPPADAPGCAGFHALIRQNFDEREIGMLFGAATAYPEYRTSYTSVRERYDALLGYIEDHGLPVVAVRGEPVGVVRPAPAVYQDDSLMYERAPSGRTVIIHQDDPDAVLLNGRRVSTDHDDEYLDDEVTYYDDDDSLPPPQRR